MSAAETGHQDLHRRSLIGLAAVSADRAHVVELLDAAERLVAARPEFQLLSTRRDCTAAPTNSAQTAGGAASAGSG